ncbi:MAG: serine hydrolase domain-containing protein [Bacteroidota bacterium]
MRISLSFLTFLLLLTACQNVRVTNSPNGIEVSLQALVQEAVDDSLGDVPGVSMSVIAPRQDIHWSGAAGFADKTEKTVLSPAHPSRIASITKTFVAAAIFRLYEMDSLQLDHSIVRYISTEHRDLLAADGYQVELITLRHCLFHTSGLYDFGVGGPAYLEAVSQNPKRRWSRTDQLRVATEFGDPLWAPGGGFRYSDTGYILLGEVIENLVDSTLAYGLRQLLNFETLGLAHTWMESLEPAPFGVLPQVRRYYGRLDFTEWDNSIDLWGGGGLVATTEDVASFVQALFTGQVFEKATTLSLFLEGPPAFPASYPATKDPQFMDYRSGHHAFELYGKPTLSHSGFWGTYYIFLPELEATVVVNYTANAKQRLLKKTALLLYERSQQKAH